MIGYKCKKCNCDNPTPQCSRCGKKLSLNTMRDMWSVWRVPLKDRNLWKRALEYTGISCGTALSILFILECVLGGIGSGINFLISGGLLWTVAAFACMLLAVLLFVSLQGSETLVYVLDAQGAHMQTWHEAKRIRCYARLQHAQPDKAVPQADGTLLLLAQTRHLSWPDVKKVDYAADQGEIALYYSGKTAPFLLRLPAEEYPDAERIIQKFCKGK